MAQLDSTKVFGNLIITNETTSVGNLNFTDLANIKSTGNTDFTIYSDGGTTIDIDTNNDSASNFKVTSHNKGTTLLTLTDAGKLSIASLQVGTSTTAGNILKADASGNATWTTPSNFTVKVNSGSTEGTDLYTYNPWSTETVDFKSGTNVTLTAAAGTVTFSSPSLSLGTTSGSGNAVTDIAVSGHQITMTKGSTFLTSATGVTSFTAGDTGLTPSSATVGAVTLDGTLNVGHGGTGKTSYTIGDILYASAATTIAGLADVATGNVVISGGVGVAPSYGKVGLTTHVSGTLAVGNGGTGTSTAPTQGGIIYGASTSAYASTALGTAGQVLKSNGTSAPTWVTLDMTYLPDAVWKKSVNVASTADVGASTRSATALTGYGTSQSLACTTTAGSTTVTTTSTAGLKVGAVVSTATTALAGGTTVATIASATTFTVTNRTNITTTAITASATTATATFAAQTYAPYAIGSNIVVSGAVPAGYNGTWPVTACTTTSVSFTVSTSGLAAATTQGTIAFTIAAGTSLTTAFAQTIAALVVDGVTLALNDRVLLKNQTTVGGLDANIGDNIDNGIYYLSTLGTTSVPWVLTRVAGADSVTEVAGAVVNVDQGTSGGVLWSNNFKTTDTLGTTAMPWYQVYSSNDSATTNTANKLVLRDGSGNFSAGTITANSLQTTQTGTNATNLLYASIADSDYFRLRVGGTATNAGFVELATADDGTEPISVAQYTGTFTTKIREAFLLDSSGNTSFPGSITSGGQVTASTHINANSAQSGTEGGLSLYGNGSEETYGVIFRNTSNQGTHGTVTSDWATYFTMSNTANRGWIFKTSGVGGVASIDISGNMTLNGTLTTGGNFNSASVFSFLNSGTAQKINTGGLLTSNSYADTSKVPANGIYSKGDISTDGNINVSSKFSFQYNSSKDSLDLVYVG